ncbi:MAG TPA: GNAT family N-acetyltransferase [Solirubrobacterales bacterium]
MASIQARAWRHNFADIVAPEDVREPSEMEPRWREWLVDGPIDVRVFEQDGAVAGFAAFGACRDGDAAEGTGELYAIYVDPAAQGAGVGSALLEAAVGELRARGFGEATLWTFAANGLARTFYERHGWRLVAGHQERLAPEVRYRRAL